MRRYEYMGSFKSAEGNIYRITVYCNGFLEAFFLLTADAIRSGGHYQLEYIQDENDKVMRVDDIAKCNDLFKSINVKEG